MRIALISRSEQTRALLLRAARIGAHELRACFSEATSALASLRADPVQLLLLEVCAIEGGALRATRQLVGRGAGPLLLIARSNARSIAEASRALEAGADDVVMLSDAAETEQALEAVVAKLRTMQRLSGPASAPDAEPGACDPLRGLTSLVAIGASMGGPQALAAVLSDLPKPFGAALIAVVHIDPGFAVALARWLAQTTGFPCSFARRGEHPVAGELRLAAAGEHMVLRPDGALDTRREPIDTPYQPSIDVLFDSLAQHAPRPGLAVLLTGMGRDGALGLKALRTRGWFTIAQDETTSAVYGMPRAAAEIGAACRILPLERIGQALSQSVWELSGVRSPRSSAGERVR